MSEPIIISEKHTQLMGFFEGFTYGRYPFDFHDINCYLFKKIVEFCDLVLTQKKSIFDKESRNPFDQFHPEVYLWVAGQTPRCVLKIVELATYLEFSVLEKCLCHHVAGNILPMYRANQDTDKLEHPYVGNDPADFDVRSARNQAKFHQKLIEMSPDMEEIEKKDDLVVIVSSHISLIHEKILDCCIALASLSLPVYELLFIIEWFPEVSLLNLNRFNLVKIIESIQNSIKNIKKK